MNTDLSTQMVQMKTVATQNSVQLAVFKKSQDMQADLLNTLMQTALSPPPPGQGKLLDRQA